MVSAVLAGVAEFAGGLALLLGVGLRIVGVPLVITMLVAVIKAQACHYSHTFKSQQQVELHPSLRLTV